MPLNIPKRAGNGFDLLALGECMIRLSPRGRQRIELAASLRRTRAVEYKSLPNRREDNTHFSNLGATTMAQIAVSCMKEQKLDLATHLRK